MSERISENTLDAFKQCAEMMENHSCRAEAERTLLLVAEVRRLRGLIEEVSGLFVGGPGLCIVCGATLPDHYDDCPAAGIIAEARAIRQEKGR